MARFVLTGGRNGVLMLLALTAALAGCDDTDASAEAEADALVSADGTAGGDGGDGDAASAMDSGSDPDAAADAGIEADARTPSTERPSKRSEFASVGDPVSNQIVVFGGDDGPFAGQIPRPNFLEATWLYEPGFGWTELETATQPSARGRAGVSYDPNGQRMLMYGGRWRATGTSGNYTVLGDLWSFDFVSRTWTELHDGAGPSPSPRYFPATAYDSSSDTFFMYGGGANRDPLRLRPMEDLWAFKDGSWEQVPTFGDKPPIRMFVGYTYDSRRNRLVIFGGQQGDFVSPSYNDTYGLDLNTMTWSNLDIGLSRPSGRLRNTMTYDAQNDRYLLFGGHTNIGDANDMWAFNPEVGVWNVLREGDVFTGQRIGCIGNDSEVPKDYVDADLTSPERRSGTGFTILGDSAWLVLGEQGECGDHLDDVWSFDLASAEWTEIIPARSGEICERSGDDCQCLCL